MLSVHGPVPARYAGLGSHPRSRAPPSVGKRLSILSESRVREIRSLGSMRRDVETESWRLDCGTAFRKGRQQLRGAYRYRATSRPYDGLRSGGNVVPFRAASCAYL